MNEIPGPCDSVNVDEQFAQALQRSLNHDAAEQTMTDEQLAIKLQKQFDKETHEVASSDEDDVIEVFGGATATGPILVEDVDSDVELEPNTRATGWLIEELGERYDPSVNQDWQVLTEFVPEIKKIWQEFWECFFNPTKLNPTIGWSEELGNRADYITEERVLFNCDLKIYPRIDLLSAILRAMVVYRLRYEHKFTENSANFKYNLTRIRKHVNSLWLANIRPDNVLQGNVGVYARQWYHCTGICQNYSPFHGNYRSEQKPGGQNQWWMQHRNECGATLFRVYLATRTIGTRKETTYLKNVNHMKVRVNMRNSSFITPQEFCDLTEEDCIPITAYEEVDVDDVVPTNQEPARVFYHRFDDRLGHDYDCYNVPCPFCDVKVPRKLFGNHMDGCKGKSQKVQMSFKSLERLSRANFSNYGPSASQMHFNQAAARPHSTGEPAPKRPKIIEID